MDDVILVDTDEVCAAIVRRHWLRVLPPLAMTRRRPAQRASPGSSRNTCSIEAHCTSPPGVPQAMANSPGIPSAYGDGLQNIGQQAQREVTEAQKAEILDQYIALKLAADEVCDFAGFH